MGYKGPSATEVLGRSLDLAFDFDQSMDAGGFIRALCGASAADGDETGTRVSAFNSSI